MTILDAMQAANERNPMTLGEVRDTLLKIPKPYRNEGAVLRMIEAMNESNERRNRGPTYGTIDFCAKGEGGNGMAGMDLPPVLNGVRCVFCDGPAGKSYLVSRGRAVCEKKSCRFALAREGHK